MAGYAASSRIGSVAPRARGERSGALGSVPASLPAAMPAAIVTVELVGGTPSGRDFGRLAALRERWAQATFYLFDANSWR